MRWWSLGCIHIDGDQCASGYKPATCAGDVFLAKGFHCQHGSSTRLIHGLIYTILYRVTRHITHSPLNLTYSTQPDRLFISPHPQGPLFILQNDRLNGWLSCCAFPLPYSRRLHLCTALGFAWVGALLGLVLCASTIECVVVIFLVSMCFFVVVLCVTF